MAKFNEQQRQWVDEFLGQNGHGGQDGLPVAGATIAVAPTAPPITSNVDGAPIANLTSGPDVPMDGAAPDLANLTGGVAKAGPSPSDAQAQARTKFENSWNANKEQVLKVINHKSADPGKKLTEITQVHASMALMLRRDDFISANARLDQLLVLVQRYEAEKRREEEEKRNYEGRAAYHKHTREAQLDLAKATDAKYRAEVVTMTAKQIDDNWKYGKEQFVSVASSPGHRLKPEQLLRIYLRHWGERHVEGKATALRIAQRESAADFGKWMYNISRFYDGEPNELGSEFAQAVADREKGEAMLRQVVYVKQILEAAARNGKSMTLQEISELAQIKDKIDTPIRDFGKFVLAFGPGKFTPKYVPRTAPTTPPPKPPSSPPVPKSPGGGSGTAKGGGGSPGKGGDSGEKGRTTVKAPDPKGHGGDPGKTTGKRQDPIKAEKTTGGDGKTANKGSGPNEPTDKGGGDPAKSKPTGTIKQTPDADGKGPPPKGPTGSEQKVTTSKVTQEHVHQGGTETIPHSPYNGKWDGRGLHNWDGMQARVKKDGFKIEKVTEDPVTGTREVTVERVGRDPNTGAVVKGKITKTIYPKKMTKAEIDAAAERALNEALKKVPGSDTKLNMPGANGNKRDGTPIDGNFEATVPTGRGGSLRVQGWFKKNPDGSYEITSHAPAKPPKNKPWPVKPEDQW